MYNFHRKMKTNQSNCLVVPALIVRLPSPLIQLTRWIFLMLHKLVQVLAKGSKMRCERTPLQVWPCVCCGSARIYSCHFSGWPRPTGDRPRVQSSVAEDCATCGDDGEASCCSCDHPCPTCLRDRTTDFHPTSCYRCILVASGKIERF